MTYYQVEFQTEAAVQREAKRFRTEEKAERHARKVLGIVEGGSLESRATILPVSKTGTDLR
jgi:hypothetical protein